MGPVCVGHQPARVSFCQLCPQLDNILIQPEDVTPDVTELIQGRIQSNNVPEERMEFSKSYQAPFHVDYRAGNFINKSLTIMSDPSSDFRRHTPCQSRKSNFPVKRNYYLSQIKYYVGYGIMHGH
jgi:hypothetical protein